MDPQYRLLLEESWRAFEDAGYAPEQLSDTSCGVFVGMTSGDYAEQVSPSQGTNLYSLPSMGCSVAAGKIAYHFDLKGPNMALDTGCASSLVAIHHACNSLRQGESDMALAAGAYLMTTSRMHTVLDELNLLSSGPRCRPFSKQGDGFILSEAVGVVILKSLKKAVDDGDHIYGVIKASGYNQGGTTNGLGAPCGLAQQELMTQTYKRFNIESKKISYVEAMGLGSCLADQVELNALIRVFGQQKRKKSYCVLGSIKGNMGHCLMASGVVALIKVLLCMKHKTVLPTLHYREEDAVVDFAPTPFRVNRELRPWDAGGGCLRQAAITSFGLSGTNAHVVLEEYIQKGEGRGVKGETKAPCLIVLSAKNEERLRKRAENLRQFILHDSTFLLSDLAYTLQTGREAMEERLAFPAKDHEELLRGLSAYVESEKKEAGPGVYCGRKKQTPPEITEEALIHYGRKNELEKLADYWTRGVDIPWPLVCRTDKPGRISLPAYPFERRRCWIDGIAQKTSGENGTRYFAGEASCRNGKTRSSQEINETVLEIICRQLRLNPHEISLDTAFEKLGVDSIRSIRFLGEINDMFQLHLPANRLGQFLCISDLCRFIEGQLKGCTEEAEEFPALYSQQALYAFEPAHPAYTVCPVLEIRSEINVAVLREVFQILMDRHAALRVTFIEKNGEPAQKLHAHMPVDFEEIFMEVKNGEARIEEVLKIARLPFDLEGGPLMRIRWLETGPQEGLLFIAIHHLVIDGWSLWMIMDEAGRIYQALKEQKEPALPPVRYTFVDYLSWQKNMLRSDEGEKLWAYWRKKLSGKLPELRLPLDRPRPSRLTFNGVSHSAGIPDEWVDELRQWADQEKSSLFVVFLAAYYILLHRYTGQEDLLICSPTTGRNQTRFSQTAGYLSGRIITRATVNNSCVEREFLHRIHEEVVSAMEHQDYPVWLLTQKLNVKRVDHLYPLFQTSFALQQAQVDEKKLAETWGGLQTRLLPLPELGAWWDLALEVFEARPMFPQVFFHRPVPAARQKKSEKEDRDDQRV